VSARPKPYYLEWLTQDLARRKQKNPRYSMRAFARHLGLDPSGLNRVLTGQQDFSLSTCLKLVKRLDLSESEQRFFFASVADEKKRKASQILAQAIGGEPDADLSAQSPGLPSPLTEWQMELHASSIDFIVIVDRDNRFLYVNAAAARFLGAAVHQLIGKTWKDAGFLEDDLLPVFDGCNSVFESGKTAHGEFLIQTKEGERVKEFILTPIFDKSSTRSPEACIAVICSIRDITDRKKAEHLLTHLLSQERIARELAERRYSRILTLQKITTALGYARTSLEVARIVMKEIIDSLGALRGWIGQINTERTHFELLESVGQPGEVVSHFDQSPLDSHTPHADVVRFKKPIWLESAEVMRIKYPQFGEMIENTGALSGVMIPLMIKDDVIGVMGMGFENAHEFDEEERAFIETVGHQCAQALDRAYWVERKISEVSAAQN
jgi:PAS domain S-box-containing protein